MGYTTEFDGSFKLDKPLKAEHAQYLAAFNNTRRMKRNPVAAETLPDPVRKAVDLPLGPDAAYFVGGAGFAGQDPDASIVDYNLPPAGQPGLWCKWAPNKSGTAIEWDGAEKFYDYVEWLEYLVANFLKPWGYVLNGEVTWQGEESDDRGKIVAKANQISTRAGRVVYDE
jgi:hypothetical protein